MLSLLLLCPFLIHWVHGMDLVLPLSKLETTLHTKVFLGKTDEVLELLQLNSENLAELLDCNNGFRCPLETAIIRGHLDLASKLIDMMRELEPSKPLRDILLRWNNPMLFEVMWKENKVGTKYLLELLAETVHEGRYQNVRYHGSTAMDYAKSHHLYEMERFLLEEMKWNERVDTPYPVDRIIVTPSDSRTSASPSPGKPPRRKVSLSPKRTFDFSRKSRRRSMSSPILGQGGSGKESIAAILQQKVSAEEAITGSSSCLAEVEGSSTDGTDHEESPKVPVNELRKRKQSPRNFSSLPDLFLRRSDSDSSKKKAGTRQCNSVPNSHRASDGESSGKRKASPRLLDSPSGSPRINEDRKLSPRGEALKSSDGTRSLKKSNPSLLSPETTEGVKRSDSEPSKQKSSSRFKLKNESPK